MNKQILVLILTILASTYGTKDTLSDIKQFTKGWLVGVFNQDVAGEAAECLNLQALEGHIQNAINDFKKKTPEGIKDGMIELFEFFVALPQAVDICLTQHADVKASIKAKTAAIINLINKPDELWMEIAKNTITHGVTIFGDIQNGIDAINQKNWYEVGKNFGDAADLALFGSSSSLKSTEDDITNFLRGWLIGVFNTDVAGNVVECLDITSLKGSIDRMIADFSQKNVDGIVNGIKEIFGLCQALPAAINSCLQQQQDVAQQMQQKVSAILAYLSDPASMAAAVLKNSIKHGFTLFGDISDGISAINKGNWQQAGTDFGDALDLALFGNTRLRSVDDVKAFLKGWLIGVFNQDVAGEVVECLDIASLEDHIQKAIEDFEEKTVQGIKNGILELFEVFKALPGAITSCLSQHPDVAMGMVARVKAIVTYIEDPVLLGKVVLGNVFKHGITIFHDIENGVSSIQQGNYQEAGTDFGDALDMALFGALAQSQDLTNAQEFMRGLLIGVFDQDVAAEATECLNLQDLITHIDNAFIDFKKGTAAGIEEGLVELLDVFMALPGAIDVCLYQHGDVAADMKNHVQAIISYIQNPSQLKQIVSKNFLLYGLTIVKDVEDAYIEIKAQNWRLAGTDFGDAIDLSLFGQLGATSQSMTDFLKGFLHGFFHEDVAEEVTECLDILSLEEHISQAIDDFKQLNLQGFLEGFKELLFVYNSMKTGVQTCIADHPDLVAQIKNKIETVEQIIQDPSQLEQIIMANIEAHGLKIVLDINEALKNIQAGEWHQAGYDFGEVIDIILFGLNKLQRQLGTIEDIDAFTQGLLVGIFRDDIVAKVTDCMDLDSVQQHLENALKYFSQFTLQGFEDGFRELLLLYQETSTAAAECLKDYPEIEASVQNKIKIMTQIINDPKQLEKVIMANVQNYGTAILADLKDVSWAVKNKQWYQAGHDMGDLINLLLFGNNLKIDQDQITKLVQGFLIGIFQEDVAGEVVQCLKLDEVYQHIQTALDDFKKLSLDGFKDGILELLQIYEMLNPAIDKCLADYQEVAQKMKAKIQQVEVFVEDPSKILPTIEANFIYHPYTITKDILACLYALESGDYLEAGKDLGESVNYLLFAGQNQLKISQDDIKAFIKGWIIGVFKEDVAGEVVECLNLEEVNQHLQAALADFKKLTIEGFEQGFVEILIVVKLLPAGIDQCMSQHQDVAAKMKAKIAQIETIIQDPSQLLSILKTNFLAHAFTIIKDIAGAGADIFAKNWQEAGKYLGEVVDLLLFGGENKLQMSQDEMQAFVKGWLIGVFKKDVAGEVYSCLDIEEVNQHLRAALSDFIQHNIEGFKAGVKEILSIFEILPPAIESCLSTHQDIAQQIKAHIEQLMQIAENPEELLELIKKNGLSHGFDIIKDVAHATTSIMKGDWEQAGEALGDCTNLLIFGGQKSVVQGLLIKLGLKF